MLGPHPRRWKNVVRGAAGSQSMGSGPPPQQAASEAHARCPRSTHAGGGAPRAAAGPPRAPDLAQRPWGTDPPRPPRPRPPWPRPGPRPDQARPRPLGRPQRPGRAWPLPCGTAAAAAAPRRPGCAQPRPLGTGAAAAAPRPPWATAPPPRARPPDQALDPGAAPPPS